MEGKVRCGPVFIDLQAAQSQTIRVCCVETIYCRDRRTITTTLQKFLGGKSAVFELAERVGEIRHASAQAVFKEPFRFQEFFAECFGLKPADDGMRYAVRSERNASPLHGAH